MPFKGTLTSGKTYKIAVDNDPGTPGVTALALAWVPLPGIPPATPMIDAIAPGMHREYGGVVPGAQLLLLDFDLPDAAAAKIEVRVEQDGTVIAGGAETADRNWTFLVIQ